MNGMAAVVGELTFPQPKAERGKIFCSSVTQSPHCLYPERSTIVCLSVCPFDLQFKNWLVAGGVGGGLE